MSTSGARETSGAAEESSTVGCDAVSEVRRGRWSDCGREEDSCRQGRMAA